MFSTSLQLCVAMTSISLAVAPAGVAFVEAPSIFEERVVADAGWSTWLDDSLGEAFYEATISLGAFFFISSLLARRKRWRLSKRKAKQLSEPRKCGNGPDGCDADTKASCTKTVRAAACETDAAPATKMAPAPPAPAPAAPQPAPLPAANATSPQTDEGNMLAAAVRRGRVAELPRLLSMARARTAQRGFRGQELADCVQEHLTTALKACAASRNFKAGLAAYDEFVGSYSTRPSSAALLSVLLYVAAEAGEFDRCMVYYRRLRGLGVAPSGNDFVNLARGLAGRRDTRGLTYALDDIRSVHNCIDAFTRNRSVAACCAEGASELAAIVACSDAFCQPPDSVTYNTLLKDFARRGQHDRCMELREEMRARDVTPSDITFGILLDACLTAKDFKSAQDVCKDLASSGMRLNAVHCTSYVKGLVSAGRIDEAAGMLKEMEQSPKAQPDVITYSTLVKAYAEIGDFRAGLALLKRMVSRGTKPDEIIFNHIISSCTVPKCSPTTPEVLFTFEALIEQGMRPTTTTVSILLKALALSQGHTEALEVLEKFHDRFGRWPEHRLYAQLIQTCAKDCRDDVAADAVDALCVMLKSRGTYLDEATQSRLLRCCASSGQTAALERLRALPRSSDQFVKY
mmetsp:Transcript_123270/g.348323  ORF Transcript_123270/g.348323 Transcript_123270/m.348323 type:complete len:630 (+) Transcript_123270:209-2098(+)